MKQTTILLIVLAAILAAAATIRPEDKGLARVQRISGKYVFVMSEPVSEYEVVEDLSREFKTQMLGRGYIRHEAEQMIKKGNKMIDKGEIERFDAIITDGDRGYLIVFK